MKSAYEKTEVITMDEKSYKCEEKGAPRNPQHTQTIDLTIGSGEAKEVKPNEKCVVCFAVHVFRTIPFALATIRMNDSIFDGCKCA